MPAEWLGRPSPRRAGCSRPRGCSPIRSPTGAACRAATGAPVVVVPGLPRVRRHPAARCAAGCGSSATGRTRRASCFNVDCADRAVERVERLAEAINATTGRRVAIIGHSRGGHLARAIAARRPELVSHAISMGADLQGLFGISSPTRAAVAVVRRGLHLTAPQPRPRLLPRALRLRVHPRLHGGVPGRSRAPDLDLHEGRRRRALGARDRRGGRLRRGHRQPRRADREPQGVPRDRRRARASRAAGCGRAVGQRLFVTDRGAGEPVLLITGWTISSAVFDPVARPLPAARPRGRLRPPRRRPLGAVARAGLDGDAGRRRGPRAGRSRDRQARTWSGCRWVRPWRSSWRSGCRTASRASCSSAVAQAARRPPRAGGARGCRHVRDGAVGQRAPPARLAGRRAVLHTLPRGASGEGRRVHALLRSPPRAPVDDRMADCSQPPASAAAARLHRVRAPTLVLHGGRDVMAPVANAHLLADGIPGAELHVVPEAGHAVPLEQPVESARLLVGLGATTRGRRAAAPRRRDVIGERLTRPFALHDRHACATPATPPRRLLAACAVFGEWELGLEVGAGRFGAVEGEPLVGRLELRTVEGRDGQTWPDSSLFRCCPTRSRKGTASHGHGFAALWEQEVGGSPICAASGRRWLCRSVAGCAQRRADLVRKGLAQPR